MINLSMLRSYKPEFVARRLHDLSRNFGDVSGRVRLCIVDAVRAAVADMARDAVDTVLSRRVGGHSVPTRYQEPRDEYDPWADDQDQQRWSEPEDCEEPVSTTSAPDQRMPAGPCALAIALGAAGWWLQRQGTLLGALGLALLAATAATLTKRLAWNGLPVVEAAGELLSLQRCLAVFAALLTKA